MLDASGQPKTEEQLEREWWDAWWEADYSWDGLAKRQLEPDKNADGAQSLQDFWRRIPLGHVQRSDDELKSAGTLVYGPDGVLWHLAHLPPRWRHGEQSWKADLGHTNWSAVERLIEHRIGYELSRPRQGGHTKIDVHLPLVGAVLRGLPVANTKATELAIDFRQGAFLGCVVGRKSTAKMSNFSMSLFRGGAVFDGAVFSGEARFDQATILKLASFRACRFDGEAHFKETIFVPATSFAAAIFSSTSRFHHAQFLETCTFVGARFDDVARFTAAIFVASANFEDAAFAKQAWFSRARDDSGKATEFRGEVTFKNVEFADQGRFGGAHFLSRLDFEGARFSGFADFSFCTIPPDEPKWRGALRGTLFKARCDLRGIPPNAVSIAGGAAFDGGVLLDAAHLIDESAGHSQALKFARQPTRSDEALRELESGATRLKLALQRDSSRSRAHRFHKLELRARELQSTTPLFDRAASCVYGIASDHGESIARPAFFLCIVAVITAVIYALAAGHFRCWPFQHACEISETVTIAVQRTLLPLGDWARTSENFPSGSPWDFLLAVAGMVHRIVATALLFLLLLAVRRKFQIS